MLDYVYDLKQVDMTKSNHGLEVVLDASCVCRLYEVVMRTLSAMELALPMWSSQLSTSKPNTLAYRTG